MRPRSAKQRKNARIEARPPRLSRYRIHAKNQFIRAASAVAEPLAWANSQNLGGGKFWLFAEAYLSNIFNLALI